MSVTRRVGIAITGVVAGVLAIPLVAVAASDDARARPGMGVGTAGLPADAVPEEFRELILSAAAACDQGLPATVLAAQLEQESGWNHDVIYNRNRTSSAGAMGIAQFMPGTWPSWSEPGDDPYDPADAIPAQGRMMCSLLRQAKEHPEYNGSPIELALAGYNAGWGRVQQYRGVPPESFAAGQTYHYVESIMAKVRAMNESGLIPAVLPADYELPADTPSEVVSAVAWALENALGGEYGWGGDCTDPRGNAPAHRCDCSSLVQQSYRTGGVELPRTTYDQVRAGKRVDMDAPLPGDLVFSAGFDGTAAAPGHIGLYIGNGQIIEAPRSGVKTRLVSYESWRTATDHTIRITEVRRVVDW
ncbi:NlpC/P60 family protein [Streptomyces sp. G-5]|uniref:C40 family peptidase n=1 Tax=Streptomyces sp. G-5 TaxID=2977231 RepID=UPI0021CFD8D4|nr:bifunctional lytic transglycosylase/C40 family peptidase [Streptomyces sp. G-5]MCU4750303.1 bifunctional lytic transglycosylase/C40 family peptidase [Streptomyces sp. G-5]